MQMLEMIAAAKEMKDSLQTGIAAFNKNPIKGMSWLERNSHLRSLVSAYLT